MKVGIISFIAALLLALPAFAGPADPCADPSGTPDIDTDGIRDECDNCSAVANASQVDGDQDGFGDICDCEFGTGNGACDGPDFTDFVQQFGTTAPPTNCHYDKIVNGAVDGPDFTAFVLLFGGNNGPSCGGTSTVTTDCAGPGAVCP